MPHSGAPRIIPITLLPPADQRREGENNEVARLFQSPPPLSLYVHFPWCVKKCPYCDFNSHSVTGSIPESAYVAALIDDLEAALPLVWGRKVVSVFFGGGTPSLLSVSAVDTLLDAFRARLPLLPDAEITLEANPGSIAPSELRARLAGFRAAGINRLSLGVQSFNPTHLTALGRIHSDSDARHALEIAMTIFENVNIDLMHGLPAQTLAEASHDIESALAFRPTHLSCYQLTIEANTRFAAAPPRLPEPDLCADMQEAIEARLADAGFIHYETSAFARADRQCRHNLNYWTFGDYLGIGAGAHGKISLHDRVLRQRRISHPERYLAKQGSFVAEEHVVAQNELPFEFMLNALRLVQGFDAALFQKRTTIPLAQIEKTLAIAEKDALIERRAGRITPTLKGQRFLNQLLERFLDEGKTA